MRRLVALSIAMAASVISNTIFAPAAMKAAHRPPPTSKSVRVAAIQFISQFAKPAENRKALEPLVREAARNGAKIVVLPETAIPGYMSRDIIGANWSVPKKPAWHGYGQSLIIRRDGRVAAKVKNDLGNETIYAELAMPAKAGAKK